MLFLFLAGASQTPGNAARSTGGLEQFAGLLPFVLLFVFMWFLLIRPQKKQQEAHRQMVAALKKGDRVVTAGGIIGEVMEITEDEVRVRIADKVESKFIKSSISRVLK